MTAIESGVRPANAQLIQEFARMAPAALGGSKAYNRQRVRAGADFLSDHDDLDEWMSRPLGDRLVEIDRRRLAWHLLAFGILTGSCRSDFDFLAAKHFGHSVARWTRALFPQECERLLDAADRLGIPAFKARQIVATDLSLAVAFAGVPPGNLTVEDLGRLGAAIEATPMLNPSRRRVRRAHLFALRKMLFEAHMIDLPAVRIRNGGPSSRPERLQTVTTVEIRRAILAYLDARAAVLRPKTIEKLTSALGIFGEFVSQRYPEITSLKRLQRVHVEAFLAWTATRPGRGNTARAGRQAGPFVAAHAAFTLRNFLDDITAWGWADAPRSQLVFATDIPRQPEMLPRGLAPDVDAALMAAVTRLDDVFARTGLTILRHTGLRRGELLDLELDCVVDYGASGSWLRVPLGKLNTERAVPLDQTALDAFDTWFAHRRHQRSLPHPRHGRPVDFVFVEGGHRLGGGRLQIGLRRAAHDAGLVGADGQPLHVVAHQLRHTYATSLVNAGMSLQALMTLLGHTSPEMTIRYARLSSPTIRAAYEQAIGKLRPRIAVVPTGRPAAPDRVEWLRSEMLKTRVAHGYCSRDLAADACPYANICENCPNFITTAEFLPAIEAQLADIIELRHDAQTRGWDSEAARHQRVIDNLEDHLRRLQNQRQSRPSS
jgi:integrase